MAIAAMVCGIIGVLLALPIPALTIIISILAIILGVTALKNPAQSKGMATAGVVLGIIGTVLSVVAFLFVLLLVGAIGSLTSLFFSFL